MSEAPAINPLIYVVIGIWIVLTLFGFVTAIYQARTAPAQTSVIVGEINRVTTTLRMEGRATRDLLMRQDRRRAKRLAREAKLRLDLGPEAEAVIAVQRIVDAGARDREEIES